jgi:ER-bound oxygenase mpaB/B'/Rubber oxygenase, catalytic domain
MSKQHFVNKDSIVREIWGKSDTILFIFAGASAEFALNKATDWLYFTGKLPADPIGRLFTTVSYARQIVFSDKESSKHAIDTMTKIHSNVETKRGYNIPDWAYRDVLFMLIDYSIRAYELLKRKLTLNEKEEVFCVFYKVGFGMNIKGLPKTFNEWETMRSNHLKENLEHSIYTSDLYKQYHMHLGFLRYYVLLETQKLLVPNEVYVLLSFKRKSILKPLVVVYKWSRYLQLDWIFKAILLPHQYKTQIKSLDITNTRLAY